MSLKYFLILFLGMMGVGFRFLLQEWSTRIFLTHPGFPSFLSCTFFINILGSFLIGVVYVLSKERAFFSSEISSAIMIGFLGGFTTFSSFSLEVIHWIEKMQVTNAIFYFFLTPLLGVAAAALGIFCTRFFY